MITTRDVFDHVGEFNPALFSGGDLEWGQRAWASGIEQIYDPRPVVRHPARADWKSLLDKTRRIAGGHYTVHRLTSRPWSTTAMMTLKIAASSLRRSWSDPHFPTVRCRMHVLLIDLALRSIQLGEVLRLSLGGQPRRR
jgi:GT2 family glycosyltransferase